VKQIVKLDVKFRWWVVPFIRTTVVLVRAAVFFRVPVGLDGIAAAAVRLIGRLGTKLIVS
jgi:hypothetical protein